MFTRLRNQFIILTMAIISIVLVIAFTAIYVTTAATLQNDIVGPPRAFEFTGISDFTNNQFRDYIAEQRAADAAVTLQRLLITLILTAGVTLGAVYIIARYVAEQAIIPIRTAYEKQRQFIADASHELKTPLAVINANIDAELATTNRPSKWLSRVKDESERMGGLVNSLLSLAKLENAPASKAEIRLHELTEEVITSFEAAAFENGVTLTNTPNAVTFISDPDRIRQLITILIDNAVKYTSKDGTISIKASESDKKIELAVTNTHPTIPQKKLGKLFDRFYQADDSHHTKGHGLGLSIAQSTAEQIGGTIAASSRKNTVTFTVTLPKN